MMPSFSKETLSNEDKDAVQILYGRVIIPARSNHVQPEFCETEFDAVSNINGEKLFFKNQYYWAPPTYDTPLLITSLFPGLPELNYINTIDSGNRITRIFIDKKIYEFSFHDGKFVLFGISPLNALGIHAEKVDAVFRHPSTLKVIIFSGDNYYIMKQDNLEVENSTPSKIEEEFHETGDYNTVALNETIVGQKIERKLIFYIGKYMFDFDPNKKQISRTNPTKIGPSFNPSCERINFESKNF